MIPSDFMAIQSAYARQLNEARAQGLSVITDEMIDDSTVREWCVFTDETINAAIGKVEPVGESVDEAADGKEADGRITAQDWLKSRFWDKVKTTVMPGTNQDGSHKGWFEYPTFPTKEIKAEELTPELLVSTIKSGYNVKCDYSTATKEQSVAATKLLEKMFDREFLREYDSGVQSTLGPAGAAAGVVAGAKVGGPAGAVKGGAAGYVAGEYAGQSLSEKFIRRFNDSVKGTPFEKLTITDADLNRTWFERLLAFARHHPYITIGGVIAAYIAFKNSWYLWDRIKLGVAKLWQGKVIAKYDFKLVNGVGLSLTYDLRFNKWRLLYDQFQWTGDAVPNEEMVVSFMKTRHCRDFIARCSQGMRWWFGKEDELRDLIEMNEDESLEDAVDMIEAVLDDRKDIEATFEQGVFKVG